MKTLVRYVRKPDGNGGKGQPVGVVAAVGKGKVGWSLCCKTDRWDPEVGKAIAIGRAVMLSEASDVERMAAYMRCPDTVAIPVAEMHGVSQNYFSRNGKNRKK